MPGISRDNDTAVGDLIPTQTTVYANDEEVIRDGDPVQGHGPGEHAAPTIPASRNPNVYAENKLVVIQGDPATCSDPSTGSSNVYVYDAAGRVAQVLGVPSITLDPDEAEDIVFGQAVEVANGVDPTTTESVEYGDGGITGGGGGATARYNNTSPTNGVSGPQDANTINQQQPREYPTNENGQYINWLPHVDSGVKPQVVRALTSTSIAVGYQLQITSGYRSPEYNARVGGAKASQHVQGNAVDVVQSGLSIEQRKQFLQAAIDGGFTAFGIYNTFTHCDIRGAKVAWGSNGSRTSLPNYPWAVEVLRANGYPY
ncbi:D-Ala-D-Ala carboxypeptidase family metallohydrolase [bacterium]|nr:D-Ala-D-Ala carboxypeptidase family metallohydrolase [bacterium]